MSQALTNQVSRLCTLQMDPFFYVLSFLDVEEIARTIPTCRLFKERADRIFKKALLNLKVVNADTLECGVLFTKNSLDKGANFRTILNLCRQASSLRIANDPTEIAQVFRSKKIGQITTLRISNFDYFVSNPLKRTTYNANPQSPLDLQSLASCCINLENLQIEYPGIGNQDTTPLTRLEKLHTLELLYCAGLSNEMCATLSKIPALTSLHLGGKGWCETLPEGIASLLKSSPKLRLFSVSAPNENMFFHTFNSVLNAIAANGAELENLELMHFYFPNCEELFNLARRCKKLTALHFTNCLPIAPEDYKELMAIKPPKLNIVGMSEPKAASGV